MAQPRRLHARARALEQNFQWLIPVVIAPPAAVVPGLGQEKLGSHRDLGHAFRKDEG